MTMLSTTKPANIPMPDAAGTATSTASTKLKASLQTESYSAAAAKLSPTSAGAGPVAGISPESAAVLAEAADAAPPEKSHRPSAKEKTARKVYDNNQKRAAEMDLKRKGYEGELDGFANHWAKNQERYVAVAEKTGVPAKLIAALHWRESHGNFGTYLHQGDPLGKKAVHVPKNIPIFHKWEEAAIHALNLKKSIRDKVEMDENTTDPAALATYAEHYNGLGYHYRGKPSAYVWAGTDQYTSGKFVADGKYSSKTRDRQAGVMSLMTTAGQVDAKAAEANK
ncbi:MAG: hypothetical protein IV100_29705 [Myxococcales bacterium]|nr:hypothetical protein [Myxococcales bacterium]